MNRRENADEVEHTLREVFQILPKDVIENLAPVPGSEWFLSKTGPNDYRIHYRTLEDGTWVDVGTFNVCTIVSAQEVYGQFPVHRARSLAAAQMDRALPQAQHLGFQHDLPIRNANQQPGNTIAAQDVAPQESSNAAGPSGTNGASQPSQSDADQSIFASNTLPPQYDEVVSQGSNNQNQSGFVVNSFINSSGSYGQSIVCPSSQTSVIDSQAHGDLSESDLPESYLHEGDLYDGDLLSPGLDALGFPVQCLDENSSQPFADQDVAGQEVVDQNVADLGFTQTPDDLDLQAVISDIDFMQEYTNDSVDPGLIEIRSDQASSRDMSAVHHASFKVASSTGNASPFFENNLRGDMPDQGEPRQQTPLTIRSTESTHDLLEDGDGENFHYERFVDEHVTDEQVADDQVVSDEAVEG